MSPMLISVLLTALLSGWCSWTVATWRADAQRVSAVERAIEQAQAIATQDAELLTNHETRATATETRFRTIHREVIRYVQNHPQPVDCLDADGLRIWSDANTGASAPAAAAPDDSVSALAAAHIRSVLGFADKPRRDGADVPPMPGPAGGASGLGAGNPTIKER